MSACLGVNCHLHFGQNDRGLLHATAATRIWNGQRTRVSIVKLTSGDKKFFRRSCRDSNSQPFNYEAGALPAELFRPPRWYLGLRESPYHSTPFLEGFPRVASETVSSVGLTARWSFRVVSLSSCASSSSFCASLLQVVAGVMWATSLPFYLCP